MRWPRYEEYVEPFDQIHKGVENLVTLFPLFNFNFVFNVLSNILLNVQKYILTVYIPIITGIGTANVLVFIHFLNISHSDHTISTLLTKITKLYKFLFLMRRLNLHCGEINTAQYSNLRRLTLGSIRLRED